LQSPLFIGYAISQISENRRAILKHKEVIAINQGETTLGTQFPQLAAQQSSLSRDVEA
jgi:hypothetical protein